MSVSQKKAIVDKLLTNVSSAIIPDGYVSEMLLPQISVKQTTGKLGKYSNNHLRIQTSIMGGKGKARQVQTIVRSDTSYEVIRHGLEGCVSSDDKRNVEKPFEAERDEVLGLNTVLWLEKEKGLGDALGDTSVLTNNATLSGTAQYNDFTNSDPIGDFLTARNTIRSASGMPPDTAVMDWNVAQTLAYSPKILAALGYTANRAGQLSEQELAKAMGVERLLIAKAVFNNSVEGQTDSIEAVWGKNVIFMVAPRRAVPYQTSLGYYLTLSGESPRQVFKFNLDNPPEATGIIVRDSYDYLLSNVEAAYLIKDAIA